ncbi:hypothetical protein STCU_02309 [Strigomonas culicis]|uniref:Defective in cullin neddylation protein n=1 Tax=Strigomonas culicis TaxID=28005 RepID=S9UX18_9TRYP|nr:hypothetical protein STCU_02309 [Strigomonas culicis]|eukprot:EPY33319.1 hypothetical protein STCU_02309 [Strigomonas culicis]
MGPKAAVKARVSNKVVPHESATESGGAPRHVVDNTQPSSGGTAFKSNRSEMETYFDKLRLLDKIDNDTVGMKGIAQLMSDINIPNNTIQSYVLLWQFGASRNSRLSRSEWVTATYTYNVDGTSQLKLALNEWVSKVGNDKHLFFEMYSFLYDYLRGEHSRLMTVECAVAAWEVFFPAHKTLVQLVQWLKKEYSGSISRDLWRQVYFFLQAEENHNIQEPDTTRWPTVLSDFCEWRKTHFKY